MRVPFEGKLAGESETLTFNFISRLGPGETISTASCTATVYSGTDASPALISGSAAISGQSVTQLVVAGVLGVVYLLTCTITTSLGQTLQLEGYLAILPDYA